MRIDPSRLEGLRVTVMGLGLHGGGLAAALFFARRGARVTVTDLRDEETLKPSLERLRGLSVRLTLGRHVEEDFRRAELVIKNPAVSSGSPFLRLARESGAAVETDLSVFLGLIDNPLLAVTGSKGKSTTASALHRCLQVRHPGARLAGNITVSPLSFLEELRPQDPVVLELSSWQLADLRGGILKPKLSLVTALYPDHQDKYPDMESYLADKRVLFQSQGAQDFALFNLLDPYQRDFPSQTSAGVYFFSALPLPQGVEGAYLEGDFGLLRLADRRGRILPAQLRVPGSHNRLNLLASGLAAVLFGLEPSEVEASLRGFPGVEHRLEPCGEREGVRFVNDSAATIPQALEAGLRSLPPPLLLICGGTDKNLDFSPILEAFRLPRGIFLLEGSATVKIARLLEQTGIPFRGPYAGLEQTVREARAAARPGDTILFSPGCASFGMFLNEFDRGRKFKALACAD